ncbi:MAG: penicillin-binding protein activator [Cognatishimia sp.]|uniref:penicillin-binding protein activator n=1 Tax=Cognatishimia sp. TaxID=2211648 RepID=UPI0040596A00
MATAFKLRRRFVKGALVMAAGLGIAACEPIAFGGGGPSINTSAPVPVALLIPKTSEASGDATLAQSLENSARLAIGDLQGVQIDMRVYDTAGDALTAQNAARQAVEDGAKIILGPVRSGPTNAVGLAMAGTGINVLSFSNNTAIAGGNVFVLGATFQNTADRMIEFATRNGQNSFVTVHANNLAGDTGRDAVLTAINANSAVNAGAIGYEFSQQGAIAAVNEVRNLVEDAAPDALFLTADASGALPFLAELMPEAGITAEKVQYMGLTRWDATPQTLALKGVQDGWFALPDPALTSQFNSRYTDAFGGKPHAISGLAYDGIAAIGALVADGRSNALTTDALTQGAGFQGVNGIFRLRADGTNERGLAVATVRDKQVVILDPAPRSFAGTGF